MKLRAAICPTLLHGIRQCPSMASPVDALGVFETWPLGSILHVTTSFISPSLVSQRIQMAPS